MTMRSWLVAVGFGGLALLGSCYVATPSSDVRSESGPDLAVAVSGVFSDCFYVGKVPLANDIPAAHGTSVMTFPEHLEADGAYVFHQRLSSPSLDFQMIVKRLKQARFKIVSAPQSERDLVHLVLGGPLYRIEAQLGRARVVIFNTLDPAISSNSELSTKLALEDVVVVVRKL